MQITYGGIPQWALPLQSWPDYAIPGTATETAIIGGGGGRLKRARHIKKSYILRQMLKMERIRQEDEEILQLIQTIIMGDVL